MNVDQELRIESRAIFVLDPKINPPRRVRERSGDHPDYEAALSAARSAGAARRSGNPEVRLNPRQPSPPIAREGSLLRAVGHPLVRGGLALVAGVLTGNLLGFGELRSRLISWARTAAPIPSRWPWAPWTP